MSDFKVLDRPLPGVYLLECPYSIDIRGDFVKIYNDKSFSFNELDFRPAEAFLTRSKQGTLRGMHYQTGKAAHDKLVFCVKGRVLDVIVDTMPDDDCFNKPISVELSETSPTALFIKKGYAHGFLALDEESWMLYLTSTVYSPEEDAGILWSSISYDWPVEHPILSERDKSHPTILSLR